MKTKILFIITLMGSLVLSSCKDDFMNWDDNSTSVDPKDVPLSLTEKIARYDVLKNYTDIKLGVGVGLDLYMTTDSTFSSIANNNFDEIAIGYNMKHGAMVGAQGAINFTKVDAMLTKVQNHGLSLFGHCLVWHANQNATYLNGLIAPSISYTNLISNSTFETGISGWSAWNGNAPTATSTAYQGTGAMQIVNATSSTGGEWKTQIHSNFSTTLTSNKSYTISFYIRSDAAGSVRCSTTGTTAHYQGNQTTSNSWTKITWTFTGNGTETGLNFDLGLVAGTYYIDNVMVYDATTAVSVEQADTTKTRIIGDAMKSWISQMMTHYKSGVKAWDVVNDPIDDATNAVRTDYSSTASDAFPWMKYLGKNYAVTAFKLARQYGNGSTDKLFINDYNLESNLNKCKALIDYVKYIETNGATVDGIATQMHISITTDSTKIDEMFKLLAASGKLVKVSELDIQVNTKTPGSTELAKQAAMYQYVMKSYLANIPASQRYGITIWGISDNANEHTNWIPNDAPNLWDASYVRKIAFKGVADGLAGKDVSADFDGIIYTKK